MEKEGNVTAVLLHSEGLDRLGYPAECPFNTSRAGKLKKMLDSMNLFGDGAFCVDAFTAAGRHRLERFHTPRYLDTLERAAGGHLDVEGYRMGLGTPDCPVFPDAFAYPSLAVGATLAGAGLLLDGTATAAFCPSGGYHHAGPGNASGFCYLNDVVLACLALSEAGRKVLFVDIDVHHGDGVQAAFYDRSDVMTVSFHESGKFLFPGTGFEWETGEGEGEGYSVNVPLPVGTYDEAYLRAFEQVAVPLAGAYNPDVIVLEVGMDGLAGDPLAHLQLTNNVYADVVDLVLRWGKPVLATGGGGYHVENTVRGWGLVWSVLSGRRAVDDAALGLGGVMMESTEWHGGLRDRTFIAHGGESAAVDAALEETVETVKRTVFPIHGL